jgi:phosphate starvation-inducible PhoH-like protein
LTASPHTQVKILVPGNHLMVGLLGQRDELLRLVETAFPVAIHVRGNEITISGDGDEAERVGRLFEELVLLLEQGHTLDSAGIGRTIEMVKADQRPTEVLTTEVLKGRKTVRPKTAGQKHYVDAIRDNVITFGIGPAGTGKTYLAVALAVQALQGKSANRIILTRPAVEAGERLGFLPGDIIAKVDPYVRPLYDALYDMLEPDAVSRLLERGTIEIAPLAFMRGRAQPVSTSVLTPDGFRPIGDLAVGDLVIGSNGEPTVVLGVYPQGEEEVFRVTTQDGASTLASGGHLWAVSTASDRRRGKPHRVLTTTEMIGNLRAAHQRHYELPLLSQPVAFPPRPVPMDPYALGRLLGTPAKEGAALVAATTRQRGWCPAPSTLPCSDSIPHEYLYNSVDVRRAVLNGLLDSGIEDSTPEAPLLHDVVFLVRSMGGVASCRDGFGIDVQFPDRGERPMRFIDSIEPEGTAETVCISVAAQDSLYVTEDFLLTHNTINDSFIILDEAQNTTAEQMKMFLTRLGFGSKAVITGDVTQIDLPDGRGRSGLLAARRVLQGINGLAFVELTSRDVVRHHIVQEIVDAYHRDENS